MPENTEAWQSIGLDYARNNTDVGKNKTIAIIDSGFDLTHPMFSGVFVDGSKFKDFIDGDNNPEDKGANGTDGSGHGTGVLGISLQIAPKSRYLPIRVLDETGRGDLLNLSKAIVWAANNGADIINLSLGAAQGFEALDAAIKYANEKGIIIVAAAGNSNQSTPDYPAAQFNKDKLNLSVGSIDKSGNKSTFSSFGPSISLMAPGENIYSAYSNGRAAIFSGTSMSTPVVSASVAIGLSMGLSPEEAVQKIKSTAGDVFSEGQNHGYEGMLGSGKLNLAEYLSY
ncbi:hypothetical protein GCM10008959_19480 [Deinococcus seoulensis]|uniref:Peptidase S8/S53 domain-containing protein n=2 Tax=Deinococcus seoulensis TaxID=1837379 RepID=A0ABQ2RUI5_9DEIO|nr:hypothetical protein GCM10008959_19480 [Deinococcus seoulensis]